MNVKSIATACLIASISAIQLESEVISENQAEALAQSAHAGKHGAAKVWKNNTVHWCRAKQTDIFRMNAILRGIEQYGEALPGCIKFIEVPEKNGRCVKPAGAPSAIYIQTHEQGCWSHMGMVESSTFQQKLNIGNWCTSIGTILHEIAHSLGQAHEQSRPDRDDSVKIDMTNVRAGKEGNFTKSSTAYTAMPYDYGSIMQYSAFSFAKDNSKPTVKPINCEPNCPPISSLGANTGFTLLDQKQAADMYHCTKEQMAIRSDKIECVDWVTDPQKQPLDCAAYKAAGKCATDKRPCCSCGDWQSGMKQRKWITKVSVADCKDKYQPSVCSALKLEGMCWSGFVKQSCQETCGVCTSPTVIQDYADDMTGREVISMAGGKNFVGFATATEPHKPNGWGVLTWGNTVKHVGKFNMGLPDEATPMYRFANDGSVFRGTTKNWLNNQGDFFPPLSVNAEAFYSGKFGADGDIQDGGSITWASSGMKYTGPLVNGVPQGANGKLEYKGATYLGEMRQGMPGGAGKVTFAGGETFDAVWTQGQGTGKFCDTADACGDWTWRLF